MSTLSDTLGNIPVVDDDFQLAEPEQYPDGGIETLPAGTYDFTLLNYTERFDDPAAPTKMNAVDVELQVVGAHDAKFLGRRTGRIRVFTKKFERKPGLFVSGFGDFVRGITDTERWVGQDAGMALLNRAKDRAIPIQIRIDWEAFDKKGFQDAGGDTMERGSLEQKELRGKATVKGMRNFPAYGDETYRDSIEGPLSHEEINAQLRIRTVVPQSKRRSLAARL